MSTPDIPDQRTPSTPDAVFATMVREDAERLARTMEAAIRAGLSVNVAFQLKEARPATPVIGRRNEPELTCEPKVDIRRVTTVVL